MITFLCVFVFNYGYNIIAVPLLEKFSSHGGFFFHPVMPASVGFGLICYLIGFCLSILKNCTENTIKNYLKCYSKKPIPCFARN